MKKEKNLLYGFLKAIYSSLLKILYKPKIIGIENIPTQGPLILAGNHKHAFDPTVIMSSNDRIVHFMAKEEIFKGIHGKILSKIGLIKVHRGKLNPMAIVEADKILQNNGIIGIFPEGTRNRTDQELLKFRHGAVAIAKKTNAKIVPFAIKGEYKIFNSNIVLEYGKPIEVNNMEKEEANEYLKNEVLKLLRK